jgi:hypothetical protein
MGSALDRGYFGEQGAGFFFGSQGYILIDGPSGAAGHAANASGFDGVAYHIQRDHLVLYDNKAFRPANHAGKATAIDPAANLAKNLDALIQRVSGMSNLPAQGRILSLLQQTRQSLTSNSVRPPSNVQIAIVNAGGNSSGITASLRAKGISFINAQAAPSVPPPPQRRYVNPRALVQGVRPVAARPASAPNSGPVQAIAELARAGAQFANDLSLKVAIEQALSAHSGKIAEALALGGGALVVVTVEVTCPPGNVGMVRAKSLGEVLVRPHPNGNRQEAIDAWLRMPKLTRDRPYHNTTEELYYWFAPPGAP